MTLYGYNELAKVIEYSIYLSLLNTGVDLGILSAPVTIIAIRFSIL